uniref:Kazal-like domain-containing protein n=1 Tax=Macrostomum lignano TaxID=282301 RepID=A0A1I8F7F5_9PLAT
TVWPTLHFLPEPVSSGFQLAISYYMHQYYVNFHALLRCLTLQLLGHEMDKDTALEWFREKTSLSLSVAAVAPAAACLLLPMTVSSDQPTPAKRYATFDCPRSCTTAWNDDCYAKLGEKAGEFGAKTSPGGLVCNKQQGDCMAECARKIKAEL